MAATNEANIWQISAVSIYDQYQELLNRIKQATSRPL